ncbi:MULTISPECIES: hypothetical protein [Thermogemmatispora]|nr:MULTISPECIES: hypothetical protein [Thermogemmatispora]
MDETGGDSYRKHERPQAAAEAGAVGECVEQVSMGLMAETQNVT